MNAKISVIIPIYKVEQYLDECVESVVNQTYTNLEIILVDDGSPDHCPELCDRWAEKDARIKVIHKENGGLSDARNAGIDVAVGDYIGFVDSDDWIKTDMYEKMLQALIKENADICACNILSCYEDRQIGWGSSDYFVGNSEQILSRLYDDSRYPVSAWNKLYKKKCWETLRFPKGKICEDAFTTYRLVHEADRIVQISEPLYCYRIRPQSIMTSTFSKKRMDEEEAWRTNYEFVRDNYPSLKMKAYDFYLQRVNRILHTMTKSNRNTYLKEYKYLNGIRRKNLMYVLLRSGMGLKYRIKYLMDTFRG